MHYIWALKGYSKTDIKITLRGKNLGGKNIIYNPVHNEFVINTYKSVDKFKNELLELFKKYKIKYVHGYPSAIYEFFKELESILNIEEKNIITKNIISCLFGSEFPVPYMVDYLGNTWNLDYISWYGHSEMAILAYDEEKKNQYKPLMTYGYVEVEENKLLGTSYNNFDMPLIRYDTGDRVEGEIADNGVLEYFSIKEGREGDFIVDNSGKKIPLTALVFGRHHKMFDKADFIQVGQEEDGKVTFYVTLKDTTKIDTENMERYFDLSNVDIDYGFKIVDVPIRSKMGKMKLKV
jgi:phenylacetate-CoA ligase